jgi:hypothetical protein
MFGLECCERMVPCLVWKAVKGWSGGATSLSLRLGETTGFADTVIKNLMIILCLTEPYKTNVLRSLKMSLSSNFNCNDMIFLINFMLQQAREKK